MEGRSVPPARHPRDCASGDYLHTKGEGLAELGETRGTRETRKTWELGEPQIPTRHPRDCASGEDLHAKCEGIPIFESTHVRELQTNYNDPLNRSTARALLFYRALPGVCLGDRAYPDHSAHTRHDVLKHVLWAIHRALVIFVPMCSEL
jgi:hypothetical protein